MVHGNREIKEQYAFLEEKFQRCFAFLEEHDMENLPLGRYALEGEDIFCNVIEFTTQEPDAGPWECHRKYYDIHYIIRGEERIDVALTNRLYGGEYIEERDIMQPLGEGEGFICLRAGDFMLSGPMDAHRPGQAPGEPMLIRKAVFKVRV